MYQDKNKKGVIYLSVLREICFEKELERKILILLKRKWTKLEVVKEREKENIKMIKVSTKINLRQSEKKGRKTKKYDNSWKRKGNI